MAGLVFLWNKLFLYSLSFNKRAGPLIKTAVKIAWGPAYLSPAGSGYTVLKDRVGSVI